MKIRDLIQTLDKHVSPADAILFTENGHHLYFLFTYSELTILQKLKDQKHAL
jgi:hypothetical protein